MTISYNGNGDNLQRYAQMARRFPMLSAEEEKAARSDWQLQERPDTKLDDVAGLDDVKAGRGVDAKEAISSARQRLEARLSEAG